MPWPMMHFSIAVKLFKDKPHPCYILGSIAPDTVLIKHNSRSEYEKLHLFRDSSTLAEMQDIMTFFFKYRNLYKGEGYQWFLLGYIGHIVADIRWVEYKKRATRDIDKTVKDIIWTEENQNDFNIYNTATWRDRVVKDLLSAQLFEIDSHFSIEELDAWRRKLIDWLKEPSNEPKITLQYLSDSIIQEFIHNTSLELKELYAKILSKK